MLSQTLLALAVVSSVAATPTPAPQPIKVALSAHKGPVRSRSLTSTQHRRAISPANVPLKNFFLGTDLQWYGNLSIGTPPQPISVVFDTGSFTLEFASDQCDSSCNNQTRFITKKSSTYRDGGQTSTIDFGTGVGVDPVSNSNPYSLTLRSGSDVVSVAGLNAGRVSLYTITHQTPTFGIDPFSGIQGMGPQASGFFASLINQGLPSLFSLYLPHLSTGELTLGGIDKSKYTGSLIYAPMSGDGSGNWQIDSSGIAVNGKTTSTLSQTRTIIFDSGTSNVLFPTTTTKAIYSAISTDIQPHGNAGAYGIACSKISSLKAVIDISFTSESGQAFKLTIPTSELSVGPFKDAPSICQTLINAYDGLDLVGASLFKHYYTVWDVGNQRIGFAPSA